MTNIHCPGCGMDFEVEAKKKGTGADVSKIKRMGIARLEVVKILMLGRYFEESHSLTAKEIGRIFRERQTATEKVKAERAGADGRSYKMKRLSTDHSIGGRISEDCGFGFVASTWNRITEYDGAEYRWGYTQEPRYWLTEWGKRVPDDPKWNPHSGSETMTMQPVVKAAPVPAPTMAAAFFGGKLAQLPGAPSL